MPVGVDEQNKHPELAEVILQQQQALEDSRQREDLREGFEGVAGLNDVMRGAVKESPVLSDAEKENLYKEIDEVSAHLKTIDEQIANGSSSSSASAEASSTASSEASAAASAEASSAASTATGAASG